MGRNKESIKSWTWKAIFPRACGCFAFNKSCKHKVIHKSKQTLWSSKHKLNNLSLFYDENIVFNAQKSSPAYIHINMIA